MSPKTTIALALAAGFLGGTLSQRLVSVHAQDIPQEVRARKFVMVDDQGVDRCAIGFYKDEKGGRHPVIELLTARGRITSPGGAYAQGRLLPDATCQTCPHKAPTQ
jgi:hypothetical protein